MSNTKKFIDNEAVLTPRTGDHITVFKAGEEDKRLPATYFQKALQFYSEPEGETPRFSREVYHVNVVQDGLHDNQPEDNNFDLSLKRGNIQFLQLPDQDSMVLNFIDLRVGAFKIIVRNHSSSGCILSFDPAIRVFEFSEQPAGADDFFMLDVVSNGIEVFVTLLPGPYRPI